MYTIYAYGGGEALYTILNGIAAFLHGGYLNLVIVFSLGVGSVWFIASSFGMGNLFAIFPKYWMPMLVIVNVLFVPTTKVLVWDRVENRQYVVDNVPFFLGAFAGYSSQFGDSMRQAFESLFTNVEAEQYSRKGMVFASQLIDQTREFKIVDETTRSNMKDYCRQCIVLDGLITRKYTLEELKNAPDIWGMIKSQASSLRGIVWVDQDKTKTFLTCKEATVKLESLWNQITQDVAGAWGQKLFGILNTEKKSPKVELLQYLPVAYNYMTNTSKSAQEWIQQIVMINTLKEAHSEKYGLTPQEKSIIDRARAQYQGSWKAQAYTAAQYLPVIKCMIEGILYAFVLVILPLMMFPNGWVFIWNWVQTLFWVQLWPLTYAIIHYFLSHFAHQATSKIQYHTIAEGLTVKTQLNFVDTHWEFVAIAGMLMVAVPSLTFALIRGGAGHLLQIAGNYAGGIGSTVGEGLRELMSGNISWGNTQYGNMGWASRTLDQVTDAATINMGHNKWSTGNLERTIDDKGHETVNAKVSQGPTGINMGDSFTRNFQRQYSEAQMVSEQAAHDLNSAFNRNERASSQFDQRWNSDDSIREGVDEKVAASYTQAHSKVEALNDKFAKENNISKELAGRIIASASLGFDIAAPFLKAGITAEGSGTFSNRDTYSKAQDFANSEEYKNAISEERRYAKEIAATTTNSEAKSLIESKMASQDALKSASHKYTASQQNTKELREISSFAESKLVNLSHNSNNQFLKWLSRQPLAGTVAMGRAAANSLWERGGEELRPFAEKFVVQHITELKREVPHHSSLEGAWQAAQENVMNRRSALELDKPLDGGPSGFKAGVENQLNRSQDLENRVQFERGEGHKEIVKGYQKIGKEGALRKEDAKSSVEKTKDSIKRLFN